MIIDLRRFVTAERAYWDELQAELQKLDTEPDRRLSLSEVQRLHYLYERCSADLSRLDTFSTEPRLRAFLESLVGRAYSEIHETRAPLRIRWRSLAPGFPARLPPPSWRLPFVARGHFAGLRLRLVCHSHGPQVEGRAHTVSRPDGLAR